MPLPEPRLSDAVQLNSYKPSLLRRRAVSLGNERQFGQLAQGTDAFAMKFRTGLGARCCRASQSDVHLHVVDKLDVADAAIAQRRRKDVWALAALTNLGPVRLQLLAYYDFESDHRLGQLSRSEREWEGAQFRKSAHVALFGNLAL